MGLLRSSGRARRRRQQLRQAQQMNGEGGSGDVITSNGDPTTGDDVGGGGMSPNTIKLIRKLVIYGVVFAGMRWAKGPPPNASPSDEGGEGVTPSIARRFLSGEDGGVVEVSVVDDFLPRDVATRWRRDMVREWSRARNGRWRYATQVESYPKVLGDDMIVERNGTVHRALESGGHAYSGWELPPGESHLAREMSDAFAGRGYGGSMWGLPERVRLAVSGGGSGAGDDPPKPAVVSEDDEDAEFASDPATAGTAGDGGNPPLVLSSFVATHFAIGDFRTLMDYDVDDPSSSSPSKSPVVFFFVSLTQEGWNEDGVSGGDDDGGGDTSKNGTWHDEFGGEMRFECGPGPRRDPHHGSEGNAQADVASSSSSSAEVNFCESVKPRFNRAVLLRIPSGRTKIPKHEIRPVSWLAEEGGFRHLVLWGTYREGAGAKRGEGTATATDSTAPRREGTDESIVGTDGEL